MPDFSLPEHFDLSEHFDRRVLTQAMLLEPSQSVHNPHIEGPCLHTLQRSGTQHFEQTISFYVDPKTGLHLRGLCTCPVGFNCKHVAASLMAFEAIALRKARGLPCPDIHVSPARVVQSKPATKVRASAALVTPTSSVSEAQMPQALELWLNDLGAAAKAPTPDTPSRQAPNRRLMYVLARSGLQLKLKLHLGQLRKGGDLGSHRPHSPTPIDMLRMLPSYVSSVDEALLASLLPFVSDRYGGTTLHGPKAAATVARLLQSGQAWFVTAAPDSAPGQPVALPTPPGQVATWSDEPMAVQMVWRADAQGLWRPRWVAAGTQEAAPGEHELQLLSVPELHVFDPHTCCMRPAVLDSSKLPLAVLESLAQMPPVPNDVLPDFVQRLTRVSASRSLIIALPPAHESQVKDLGPLRLQPVVRLMTCANMPSEMWLQGHQRPPPAGQPLRQAAAQLVFRYIIPGTERKDNPVDFHYPAGTTEGVFIQDSLARTSVMVRFGRDPEGEVAIIEKVFEQLQFRPWSRLAGWALERLPALKAGLLQSGQRPVAMQDAELIVVPMSKEQWPRLLSEQLPALQAQGWAIERSEDFPFEMFQADDFEISLDDDSAGGNPWFSLGLKVTVAGQPVNLLPLLVGLVQGGWLSADVLNDPSGEVLLPWPDDTPAPPTTPSSALRRERLLRLPAARVAPLVAWLRGIFMQHGNAAGDGLQRLSRFEMGALENFAAGMRIKAPPSLQALMEQLRQLRTGAGLPQVDVSQRVQAELRPYQRDGLNWMSFLRSAQFGGILADDMGLGKTLQALCLLQGELDAGRLTLPSLVVVPTSLLGNWQAESKRFTPDLRVLVLHGKQRAQQFAEIAKAHLVVTSYPLAVRDITILNTQPWHYLILDEAQRIKNSRSQAAVVLKSLHAQHRLCLSGTPIENHLGELWSLMDFVSPGLLGNEAQFREHYRVPIEKKQDSLQADSLSRRIRPFILRRTKNEVARELPEKTETLLRVELDGAQRDLYETVRATMDKKLRDAIKEQGLARSHIVVLDALLKLRQVCCDPRLLKGDINQAPIDVTASAKLELLMDLLPTLVEDGRRILVFSQFTEMLTLIEAELRRLQLPYLKLTGETTDRSGMVKEFQEGDVPLFLISLKAGGVGLNLTAADTVILYDPWWNPAVEQQAIDRAYRIGQGKPVFVYKLVANGTVEEKMLEMQARKAGLADALLSGVASDASLTAQDFEELFKPLGS